LLQRLLDGVEGIPSARVFGPATGAARTPTVAFTLGDRHPDDVADALAEEAVFVSTGDFYASSVVRRYGVASRGGLVRAGCVAYTTADEVDRLLEGIERLARRG
jgi:selenocysteine lyase/cysteine desulfurase